MSNSSRSTRHPRRGTAEWREQRRQQAAEQRQWTWGRIRFQEDRSFLAQLRRLPAGLPGSAHKVLVGLYRLQHNRYGAVIAGGVKVAQAADVDPATFWRALPRLIAAGAVTKVWTGGGTIPGGDGHSNVYQAGQVAIPEPAPAPTAPTSPAPPERADRGDRPSLLTLYFDRQLQLARALASQRAGP